MFKAKSGAGYRLICRRSTTDQVLCRRLRRPLRRGQRQSFFHGLLEPLMTLEGANMWPNSPTMLPALVVSSFC